MNIFNKVTLQSLKKNRTRTIVTIIGIILSAAMICAVTTFASSIYNYALDMWEHEPVKTTELVTLCQEQLGWKPTTTYTVIKRLSERGILENNDKIISSLVSKDEVQAAELNEMVEKTFEGSLPAFVAAFTKHTKLSDNEVDALQQMIDRYRKGDSK